MNQTTVSIDKPVGDENDTKIGDFLQDNSTSSAPEHESELVELRKEISNVLKSLSEKERMVLTLRFGLEGHEQMTLEDIGNILNLSRERIRQIERNALKKLRNSKYAKGLMDFLAA